MKQALQYTKIVGIVLLVFLVVGLIIASVFGQLLNVLYIALIFLAVFSLLSTALLIYAIVVLVQTIIVVRDEIKPLMVSMQETIGVTRETINSLRETAQHAGKTAGTLASTAQLTRDYALAPGIRATSLVLAGRDMFKVFAGQGRTLSRVEERRKRQTKMLHDAEVRAAQGGE